MSTMRSKKKLSNYDRIDKTRAVVAVNTIYG